MTGLIIVGIVQKAEDPEGKAPKKRQKKDKNAPKKGMSAFMMFSNEIRQDVLKENPGIAFGEVGKIIGAKWKVPPPFL